jgi:hypothetical protein
VGAIRAIELMRTKLDQVMQFDELLLLHGRSTAPSTSHLPTITVFLITTRMR